MRKLFLAMALTGLICMPVLAQFPFGGGMGRGGEGMLLMVEDVQKDLKLTDEQKKSISSAREEMTKAMRAAFQDKDREAMQKAQKEFSTALAKVKEGLSSEQKKRVFQLEIQSAVKSNSPAIFKREEVQKALKLTEKQVETVKDALTDLEKDVKELMEDAKGDREKFGGAMKKMQSMGKDTFEKIAKSLSEDQKTTWKEIQGEPFKGEFRPSFGGGGRRPKQKDDI
jgi:hypothetical protein